ncbi:MAG: PQQ-binding-like beta-propeller repeat protein [Bacillota bacterium]
MAATESADNWPMFGCDGSGTRANTGEKSAKVPYTFVWSIPPRVDNPVFCSEPIIGGGKFFILTQNQELIAYNIATGKVSWETSYFESFLEPVFYQGKLIVLTKKGTLFCYDAFNGKELWAKTFLSDYHYPPLLCHDKLYLMGKRSSGIDFFALNASNGDTIWKKVYQGVNSNAFAVNNDIICFTSVSSNDISGSFTEVIALSPKNGDIIWKTKVRGANHPVLSQGMVFVGTSDYLIHALSETTGKTIWQMRLEGNINHYTLYQNYLIAHCTTGKIFALDALTGKIHWNAVAGGNTSYIFSANGMVYYRSFDPLAGRRLISGEIYSADKQLYESVLLEKYNEYSRHASIGLGYLVVVGNNCIAVFKSI